ncbi:MAG: DUF4270 family protein [Bacteroidota bacterium]
MMVFTKQGLSAIVCTAFALSLIFACSKPTIIGSDLLEQDLINVGFTDTSTLRAFTRMGDSTRTYDPALGNQLEAYLCGQFRDPIFGLTKAVPTFQIRLNTIPPDFENAVVDSIVFVAPWSETPTYGNLNTNYDLQLLTINEELDNTEQYFSNETFMADRLVGQTFFQPNPEDSIVIQAYGEDPGVTQTLSPQVRIPVFSGFAQDLVSKDPGVFLNDSSFLANYPGFQLRSGSQLPGILSFDLQSTNAGLRVYYTVDTISLEYLFPLQTSSVRMVSFDHDYSGTPLEEFIENEQLGDSLLFLQGMAGVSPVFEISYPEAFQGQLVNRAELEITVLTLPGDDESIYSPIDRILVAEVNEEDNSLLVIQDVLVALDRDNLADYDFLFGGFPTDDSPQKYRLNITAHFQEMRDGFRSKRILLTGLTRAQQPSRVVICGPDHPEYPAKLNISFTDF